MSETLQQPFLRHRRLPAILILAALLLSTSAYAYYTTRAQHAAPRTLPDLETAVAAPTATAQTWLAYANALRDAQRTDAALAAYRHALELDPTLRDARLNILHTLLQAKRLDDLVTTLKDFIYTQQAKVVLDFLDSPAAESLTDFKFRKLRREAARNAID